MIPIVGVSPREMKAYVHIKIYRQILFIIAQRQKQPKCPSAAEWVKHIYFIMEHYLSIKETNCLVHATMWINLEHVTLSERRQTHKTTYCTIPFIWISQTRWNYRNRKSISVCLGFGLWDWGVLGGFWLRSFRERWGVTANGDDCTTWWI